MKAVCCSTLAKSTRHPLLSPCWKNARVCWKSTAMSHSGSIREVDAVNSTVEDAAAHRNTLTLKVRRRLITCQRHRLHHPCFNTIFFDVKLVSHRYPRFFT